VKRTIEIHIGSMVGWDEELKQALVDAIRAAVDGKDLILFGDENVDFDPPTIH